MIARRLTEDHELVDNTAFHEQERYLCATGLSAHEAACEMDLYHWMTNNVPVREAEYRLPFSSRDCGHKPLMCPLVLSRRRREAR